MSAIYDKSWASADPIPPPPSITVPSSNCTITCRWDAAEGQWVVKVSYPENQTGKPVGPPYPAQPHSHVLGREPRFGNLPRGTTMTLLPDGTEVTLGLD